MSKGTETRQAVLEEAARVASRGGLGGLTIGSLATTTQLSKSGLFAHFQSKEALQLQLLDHTRERFIDLVVRPALAAPRGEPRVRELFRRWLAWDADALPGGCLFLAPRPAAACSSRPAPSSTTSRARSATGWPRTSATGWTPSPRSSGPASPRAS